MHILFLTDNFPPESNAPAVRTYEHAIRWVAAGYKVTVVTCFPNFPDGKIFSGYKNGLYSKETMDGIDVIRVKTYMTANEGFLKRTLDYVSFMLSGSIAALFVRRPDVVIATSPQFFCGLAGMLVSTIRRKKFILEVRDIWPASIVALGLMEDTLTIRMLEKLEKLLYRSADAIVVVTHIFKDEIGPKVSNPTKISIVLNGVNGSLFVPQAKSVQLMERFDLQNKFVVGYIGTHGMAHDLGNVVSAIEHLRHREDILFIFVGAGAERNTVENLVAEKGLSQVRMINQQPRERMPEFLGLCDLSLVPLRDAPLFATVIPSKLFECMSMGVPVLMALPEGEATKIVESTGCGRVVEPAQPIQMAVAIEEMVDNPLVRANCREAGLNAAVMYSRDAAAAKMLDVIKRTVN